MKSTNKAVKKAAIVRKKAAVKKTARVAHKAVAVAHRPKIAAVAAANGDAKVAPMSVFQEEYSIEARNFGPIAEAKLMLKPLTVLIGPSNTGKTYMAMLACMMMKKHAEFTQAVRQQMWMSNYESTLEEMDEEKLKKFTSELIAAIEKGGDFLLLSDIPAEIRKNWHPIAEKMFNSHWDNFDSDMRSYYGVSNVTNLVASVGREPFMCEYGAIGRSGEMAKVRVGMHKNGRIASSSKFSDLRLPVLSRKVIARLDEMGLSSHRRELMVIIHQILRESIVNPTVHFLPASRGGLLQAQRLMSMAMMRIGSRAGLAEIPTIPMLSRANVDFLEDVNHMLDILSQSRGKSAAMHNTSKIAWAPELARLPTNLRRIAEEVANALKKTEQLLEGEIIAKIAGENGGKSNLMAVPTMGYRPGHPMGVDAILEMAESSSMVSEIAPLVLYLRGGVGLGDTLFIEEPEAHLHPAAQATMAEILASMVRAGIRVVITTHSDWLLDSIANLVRQGESGSGKSKATLKSDDVGVWLFKRDNKDIGSTAMPVPFDNSGGYIPESLSDFFIDSHNRSAGLRVAYAQAQLQKKRQ